MSNRFSGCQDWFCTNCPPCLVNRPGPVLFGEVSPSSAKHRVAGASRRRSGAPGKAGKEMEVSPTSPPKKSSQNHPKSGDFPRKIGVTMSYYVLLEAGPQEMIASSNQRTWNQQTYQKRKSCSTSRVLWLTCTVQGQARCRTVSTGQNHIYPKSTASGPYPLGRNPQLALLP